MLGVGWTCCEKRYKGASVKISGFSGRLGLTLFDKRGQRLVQHSRLVRFTSLLIFLPTPSAKVCRVIFFVTHALRSLCIVILNGYRYVEAKDGIILHRALQIRPRPVWRGVWTRHILGVSFILCPPGVFGKALPCWDFSSSS